MSDGGNSGGGEKTLDPTARKLEDARKKGDIVKSQDISVAASYLGLAIAFVVAGPTVIDRIGTALGQILAQADRLSTEVLRDNGDRIIRDLLLDLGAALTPIFGLPILAVILSVIAQRAVVFAPDKLMPKLSRISPLSIAKNKFGPTGLFEFAKSFVKLMVISILVAVFFRANTNTLLGSIHAAPNMVSKLLVVNLVNLIWLVFTIALVISVADYFWQAFDHKRKLMMSRQEVMDEHKSSEGDPHLKQQRRQRGYDIATQRMMADVPLADVVIVNPQHYAIALKWNRKAAGAPICVAKGVDLIAARIREVASESAVPIHRDPPTARAIFAVVDIGQEIRPEHYKAVAAAIRFAEKMRGLAKRRARS